MSRLRVQSFSISIDGFGAGPNQDLDHPIGVGGLDPWPDESWKGWLGDDPPYHTPVFVLTHHPRARADRDRRWHHVLSGIDLLGLAYEVGEHVPTDRVTHLVLTKRKKP